MRISAALLLFITVSENAVALPPACEPNERSITSTKIERDVTLENNRSEPARIKSLSDTAASGQTRSEQCFRYEVHNTDNKEIRQFFWPLAGMSVDPLPKEQMRVKVRRTQILENPIDSNTRMFAFENHSGNSRAWAEERSRAEQSSINGLMYSRITPAKLPPNILKFLNDFNPQFASSYSVNFSGDTFKTPYQSDMYVGPDFRIVSAYMADRNREQITFLNVIEFDGQSIGEIRYSVPYLFAMERYQSPSFDLDMTNVDLLTSFAKNYVEASQVQLKVAERKLLFMTKIPVTGEAAKIYTVSFPIKVVVNGRTECITLSSFAPVPMSFPLQECRRYPQR